MEGQYDGFQGMPDEMMDMILRNLRPEERVPISSTNRQFYDQSPDYKSYIDNEIAPAYRERLASYESYKESLERIKIFAPIILQGHRNDDEGHMKRILSRMDYAFMVGAVTVFLDRYRIPLHVSQGRNMIIVLRHRENLFDIQVDMEASRIHVSVSGCHPQKDEYIRSLISGKSTILDPKMLGGSTLFGNGACPEIPAEFLNEYGFAIKVMLSGIASIMGRQVEGYQRLFGKTNSPITNNNRLPLQQQQQQQLLLQQQQQQYNNSNLMQWGSRFGAGV